MVPVIHWHQILQWEETCAPANLTSGLEQLHSMPGKRSLGGSGDTRDTRAKNSDPGGAGHRGGSATARVTTQPGKCGPQEFHLFPAGEPNTLPCDLEATLLDFFQYGLVKCAHDEGRAESLSIFLRHKQAGLVEIMPGPEILDAKKSLAGRVPRRRSQMHRLHAKSRHFVAGQIDAPKLVIVINDISQDVRELESVAESHRKFPGEWVTATKDAD